MWIRDLDKYYLNCLTYMRIRALILKLKDIFPKISFSTLFTKALEYYCYA